MNSYRNRIFEQYASVFKGFKTTFDSAAANRWGRPYNYYFRNWLPDTKSDAILDLACGDGKLIHFLTCRGYTNIQGIDISHEQVSIAKQVCANIHEGDLRDFLENHPDTFMLITGIDIIEHFNKNEVLQILDSCFSALKSKGRLILQTPNSDSPMSNSAHYGDFTHEVQLNASSLTNLLSLCGFESIEAREQGPVLWGCGVKSSIRMIIWQGIRGLLQLWNLVETGGKGSGVYSRVFIISGIKP